MRQSRVDDLLEHIAALERELEGELNRVRDRWNYRIDARRVRFERGIRTAHRRLRQGIPRYLRESSVANVLTAPLVYSMIVPIALLDFWITIYQAICFRIYGIPHVRRSRYVVVDRHHFAYLNGIEKLNCVFCGYANGVFAYLREIAGRTEQYWCPIRHASRVRARHRQYRHFVDYGDAEGFRHGLLSLRKELKDGETQKAVPRIRSRRSR